MAPCGVGAGRGSWGSSPSGRSGAKGYSIRLRQRDRLRKPRQVAVTPAHKLGFNYNIVHWKCYPNAVKDSFSVNIDFHPTNWLLEQSRTGFLSYLTSKSSAYQIPMLPTGSHALTVEQRRMYASEKLENFRWISKIVATYSPYTLTDVDLAPQYLYKDLAELGQFAEVAYSTVPIQFLIDNFAVLSQPGYPLENYTALTDVILVDSFRGNFADLPVYIAYRSSTAQLIVAISGTSSIKHVFQDLRVLKCSHSSGQGAIHSGFWALFQGIRAQVLAGISKGIKDHSPTELVLTGHSMGGSIAYLLCAELLADENSSPLLNLSCQIAVFGAPRTGDARFVDYFRELVASLRSRKGEESFKEYAVKGYNDGVPALPPTRLGYRHFCKEAIYTIGGRLYRTPSTESEHALFRVQSSERVSLFPKGGHNYYNGRDLERFARRIGWLDSAQPTEEGWEARYNAISKGKTGQT